MAVDAMEEVLRHKGEGNTLFKAGEFLKAAAAYTKAIKVCSKDMVDSEEMAPIYSNRSAAFLKLNKVKQALADAETCLKIRPDWEKAHFRKGCALELSGDVEGAIASLEAALAKDGSNKEIRVKLKALVQKSKGKSGFQFAKSSATPGATVTEDPKKSASTKPGAAALQGDPSWLAKATDLRLPASTRLEAVNSVGRWISSALERLLQQTPGDAPWFFEDSDVIQMLDAGLMTKLLGVIAHSICFIIKTEKEVGDSPEALPPAQAAADLAVASTGVVHNLFHPILAAWKTRTQQMSLMGALMKVLGSTGSPLVAAAGEEIKPSQETSNFLKLISQIFGNVEAFTMLTGHASLMRARMLMLRAQATLLMEGKDKKEWGEKAHSAAQVFVILNNCKQEKGWEAVFDKLCSAEGVASFKKDVASTLEQHDILVTAFKKFGFEGSLGL